MVLQRFCSLSGLVGSVNNTSTVSEGRAARFFFSPPFPKRKSKCICLKIISEKSYAAFYLLFLLMLPWPVPDVSVHSVLFQLWRVVCSASVAVLSQEPFGLWCSQFIPFRWSYKTISNIAAVPHAAVWGWVLKALYPCRSCSASEKNSSLNFGADTNLCSGEYLLLCSTGVWKAGLKPRMLRGKQPFFLAPSDSYPAPDWGHRSGWAGPDPSATLSPLTTRTKTKGPYGLEFFSPQQACAMNFSIHLWSITHIIISN